MNLRKVKKLSIISVVLFSAGIVFITLSALIYFYENSSLKKQLIQVK